MPSLPFQPFQPSLPELPGLLTGPTEALRNGVWADGERDARTDARIRHFGRALELRQLAAHQHEHAIRTLGEDALHRAPGPLLVAGQLRQRLRPVRRPPRTGRSGPGHLSARSPRSLEPAPPAADSGVCRRRFSRQADSPCQRPSATTTPRSRDALKSSCRRSRAFLVTRSTLP